MEIQISTDDGSSYTTIKKLNPFVDPNDTARAPKPFSSGGYNRKPTWVLEELDLTNYAGEVVKLRFSFRTNDGLYNGFRGWLIDNVNIVDLPTTQTSTDSTQANGAQAISVQSTTPSSGNPVSEAFLSIHKMPQNYLPQESPSRE